MQTHHRENWMGKREAYIPVSVERSEDIIQTGLTQPEGRATDLLTSIMEKDC